MPLHLSGNNSDAEDLDGFDFTLGDDVQDDRLFASGSSDTMMIDMLNARGLSSYQYGGNDMHFDSIHEHLDGTPMNSSSPRRRNRHRRTKRERSASPQDRRFNGINFDPPCRRQASHGDLSHAAARAGFSSSDDLSKSQYTEALTKLAASMRQTQESREYMVRMKKEVFSPHQQKILEMAKEQLKKENEEAAKKIVTPPCTPPQEIQIVQPPRDNSPGRSSSILTGFLNTRRGTLTSVTSGLEKYMGTMNQKTL